MIAGVGMRDGNDVVDVIQPAGGGFGFEVFHDEVTGALARGLDIKSTLTTTMAPC